MPFIVDFVRCHDVGLITFKIYGVFARGNFSFICGWEVTVGENGEDAVHSFGSRGVYSLDAGMCMRATQDISPYKAGNFHITAVNGSTCDFVQAIVSDRRLSNYVVIGFCLIGLDHSISLSDSVIGPSSVSLVQKYR